LRLANSLLQDPRNRRQWKLPGNSWKKARHSIAFGLPYAYINQSVGGLMMKGLPAA
jgi:hypothetical protein